MLVRQKTVLTLLRQARKPLSPTVFVKLVFLLRNETAIQNDSTFYDFVPYKYGPFSFALYRELGSLRQNGYVTPEENQIAVSNKMLEIIEETTDRLPETTRQAVTSVVDQYGGLSQETLVKDVYSRYPWYAINSRLADAHFVHSYRPKKAKPAIYTSGYEGKSVDSFFNDLLKRGIDVVIDVRANPISRKYGFSKRHLSEITKKLGLTYYHLPNLGIPSSYRVNLNGYESYQRLLHLYEQRMLPALGVDISDVGELMRQRPSVLVCVEKDVRCCHRSRLADAVSRECGLQVAHL